MKTTEVISIGVEPDGLNINESCGSTKPEALQAAVVELSADVGIALDGDGDRLIMVDAEGNLVDGDQIEPGFRAGTIKYHHIGRLQ